MNGISHFAQAIRAMALFAALAALIACAGCSSTQEETERGVCISTGHGWETVYNRHGPITRCVLPE